MSEYHRSSNLGAYLAQIGRLADELLDPNRDVVFFLGAGACLSGKQAGLPSGADLAKKLIAKCNVDWNQEVPLSTAAFYYESLMGRPALNRFLCDQIKIGVSPSPTIERLVELLAMIESRNEVPPLVITTNYDTKFEEAYKKRFEREPQVIVYNGACDPNSSTEPLHVGLGKYAKMPADWVWRLKHTVLFKMHGCISHANGASRTLVATEEDYINFLANAISERPEKRIMNFVTSQIKMNTVVFIGYSLADWNFRVIYKATAETNHDHEAFAVRFKDIESRKENALEAAAWNNLVEFWNRKGVHIINADGAEFMNDLLEAARRLRNANGV